MLVLCAALAMTACIDRHRSITKQMAWKCEGAEAMLERNLPRIEVVRLSFRENPRYWVRVSGPHLCADLGAAGQSSISATFDTWGNFIIGLHGYNLSGLNAGSRRIDFHDMESGGYTDATVHHGNFSDVEDSRQHPELYRFPLDVFK